MEEIALLFAVLFLVAFIAVTIGLIGMTVFSVTEEMYLHAFHKPLYVHFYPIKKKLSERQEFILRQHSTFYRTLSDKHQRYFRHRIARFIARHEFIGKEGFVITDDVKIRIALTAVTLTFGMRRYLFNVVDTIIVYPSVYLSTITQEHHKGEFNPRMKAIVFSWEDFVAGHETGNDNLNLGFHEFAHVVHYHGQKNEDISAILFTRIYKRITADLNDADYRQKLVQSNYFRIYGYTNQFEFLAVLIEHYFETPQQFRQAFPELYKNVGLMLNHRHAK